jgi:hypothetical protein
MRSVGVPIHPYSAYPFCFACTGGPGRTADLALPALHGDRLGLALDAEHDTALGVRAAPSEDARAVAADLEVRLVALMVDGAGHVAFVVAADGASVAKEKSALAVCVAAVLDAGAPLAGVEERALCVRRARLDAAAVDAARAGASAVSVLTACDARFVDAVRGRHKGAVVVAGAARSAVDAEAVLAPLVALAQTVVREALPRVGRTRRFVGRAVRVGDEAVAAAGGLGALDSETLFAGWLEAKAFGHAPLAHASEARRAVVAGLAAFAGAAAVDGWGAARNKHETKERSPYNVQRNGHE